MHKQDQELTDKVQSLINSDQDLAGYLVQGRSRGGIIHLQGIVDVLAEKYRAEELLKQIPGVVGVENGITVSTDGDINDQSVEFEVNEEINADPRVQLKEVEVQSDSGVVHLRGEVRTLAEAKAAEVAASRSRGVKEVVSELRVVSDVDDASLTNRVEMALGESGKVNPYLINSASRRGVVTLHGTVTDGFMRELAEEITAGVPGVRRIENHLRLEPEKQ